ncbi:MAG: right-handed parallel beta-helix repeat-containing protein [Fibrobacteres bacterium]|nr:right-handed parallel beta-helix repeat-containing protein [Fibrobacterota bacterium]
MPQLRKTSLRTALAALTLAACGWSKNIHVSVAGNDQAAGTIGAPLATLAKAAANSAPGDTILIRGGTYKLNAQLDPKSGTSENARITYKAFPGETVLVDGQDGYCMSLTSRSWLTFDGIRFTTRDTAVGAGMVYFENTRHILFQNCEFYGMPSEHGSENSAVIRCMSTGWPDTADVENSDSCVFRNNHFHDNASPAMRLYDTKGWVIENNRFENCKHAIGGKDEPYGMLIRRNLVIGGELAFYFPMQGGGDGVTITENIVVGTDGGMNIGGLGTYDNQRRNVKMFNNTFYNVGTWLFGWSDPKFDTLTAFWNNIIHSDIALNIPAGADVGSRFISVGKYATERMEPTDYSFDYNNYSMPSNDRSTPFIDGRVSYPDLAAWRTARAPFDAHSIAADPLFVNQAARDFHLAASSPCKGAGKNGEDLGAYPRGDDGTVIGILPGAGTSIRRAASGGHGNRIPSENGYFANGRAAERPANRLGNGSVVAPFGAH